MKLKIYLLIHLLAIVALVQAQPLTSLTNTTSPFAINPEDYEDVPGFVNPNDYIGKTCFDFMGLVDFTSEYRFQTNATVSTIERQYGFSIPLVGDLDGDGYPEIVAIGQYGSASYLTGAFTYLDVYNGQNGSRLARLRLDQRTTGAATYFSGSGHHQSPSIIAMAKLRKEDVGGTKDQVVVVVTLPQLTSNASYGPYNNKVVCYNLDKLSSPVDGNYYTIGTTPRWVSAADYNSDAPSKQWDKPIPQIVDIDGDGKPEVIVYNKIYDLSTGKLLLTLDQLGSTASVGSTQGGHAYDKYIGFSYAYDLDLDGKYEIAAGNKVYYDLDLRGTGSNSSRYKTITLPNSLDGHTGVADINGDGIPDVVTVRRTTGTGYHNGSLNITVWDPGFLSLDANDNVVKNTTLNAPSRLFDRSFDWDTNANAQGSHSYVYIGDIDGRMQEHNGKKYRLPEIAILSGNINFATTPQHPNVKNQGIPTSGWSNDAASFAGAQGVIAAFTYDPSEPEATRVTNGIKLSFILGHDDRSINTGFTMFDFDNDGTQEICYRDERNLRIIKATSPFITTNMTEVTHPQFILFSKPAWSFTGFEYPVIADMDNDASAEMAVLARPDGGTDNASGFVFAIGNGSGDKFSPALSVWNQFMYDPFIINEDLTTYKGDAPNRLDKKYTFSKIIRDENMQITDIIENYSPFNGNLSQMSKFQMTEITWNGKTYTNSIEPIIFLTHAYFVEPSTTNPARNPKIIKEGTKKYIVVWVGNEENAQTDVSQNTPIAIYKNEISSTSIYKMATLANGGLNSAIKAGEERELKIEIDDEFGYYILRLGDNSFNLTAPYAFKGAWSWGTNDLGVQDATNHKGTAARAYRDCNWNDQLIRVSKFIATDDSYTLQEFKKINAPILDNDILPDDFIGGFDGSNPKIVILTQPKSGILTASGEINKATSSNTIKVTYQHSGDVVLPDGIDMFEYQISYYDNATSTNKEVKARAYFYILQSSDKQYTACPGDNLTISINELPSGTNFKWYEADGIIELPNNPQSSITLNNITSTAKYMVLPQVPSSNSEYGNINFPKGELTVTVITGSNAALKWTGAVNSLWYNPFNWTDMSGNAVEHTPIACVDVTIPMVTTNYPELNGSESVKELLLLDRAMIGNIHKLAYQSVSIEMRIKDAEQNRWLMLSAPLRKVYAGDYIARDTQDKPIQKSSYISLYNTQNPDNEQGAENGVLTRPFGKIEQALNLGTGFMLYIDKLFAINPVFQFPSTLDKYQYTPSNAVGAASRDHDSETLSRVNASGDNVGGRFIFEEASDYNTTTGSFSISLNNEKYHLIVNPFPSYLNLNQFLAENTSLEPQYKVWGGKSDDSFMSLVIGGNKAPRWEISATATMEVVDIATPNAPIIYIAPYQAFFVKKKVVGAGTTAILFNPETITATKGGDYTL